MLLSPEEFRRLVAVRLQQERPDAQIELLGQSFLMLWEDGRRRVLSLAGCYRSYRLHPERCERLIDRFLREEVYEEQRKRPHLEAVREQILPQLVPAPMVNELRYGGRDLAAMHYIGDLAIAFVIDREERYSYITRSRMRKWQVRESDLFALALRNLRRSSVGIQPPLRLGRGARLTLIWEAFDGYDASRILLPELLVAAAIQVEGNPVIAVPHRDYMVMFGDADHAFVEEMVDRVQDELSHHRYPISYQLYTLHQGTLISYDPQLTRERVVN